jgi:hypothetical protein
MLETNTSIVINRPNVGTGTITVNMALAYQAESRIREIAFANKNTAPELAAAFNQAYSDLARAYGTLHYELAMAEIALKKRKAILTLDIIPELMEKKGMDKKKSNEDTREAFCYTDPDFIHAKESISAIEAIKELVYIKMNSLRMALEVTKNILRGDGQTFGTNPALSARDLPDTVGIGNGAGRALSVISVGPSTPYFLPEELVDTPQPQVVKSTKWAKPTYSK